VSFLEQDNAHSDTLHIVARAFATTKKKNTGKKVRQNISSHAAEKRSDRNIKNKNQL
jgi:hypothetical protein